MFFSCLGFEEGWLNGYPFLLLHYCIMQGKNSLIWLFNVTEVYYICDEFSHSKNRVIRFHPSNVSALDRPDGYSVGVLYSFTTHKAILPLITIPISHIAIRNILAV